MGLKECWTYVRSDLYRITGKKTDDMDESVARRLL